MASDINQRKRHRALDELFRREEGYTVVDLSISLQDEFQMTVSERTIKSDIRLFIKEYSVQFDETLPKDGKAKRYRYADRDFSIMERILSDEDKKVLAYLLEKVREYQIDPNYSFFLSLIEHVITHQTAKDIDLGVIQFSNNAYLKGLEEWFRPLLNAIIHKQAIALTYCPYGKNQQKYSISPYMLRQFNDRWFLIARIDERDNLTSFAIDRIEAIVILEEMEYIPCNLGDISNSFFYIYGISGAFDKEQHLEKLVLKVSSLRIGYIDTKPIHPCQQIELIPTCPGCYRVTIPEIVINKELISLLLSFGADIEVISPVSLRDKISSVAQRLINLYAMK